MAEQALGPEAVKEFLAQTTRAVLMTHRKDGGFQSSPMSVVADDDGNVLLATRSANAKVRNLQRDPRAAVCLITERFLGGWMHVEGEVEIQQLPDAMPALQDFYRRRGQDSTTETFRKQMEDEDRVFIRLRPQRVVQPGRVWTTNQPYR